MIAALEATAAHGEGIDKVKPEALQLVNQFLTNPDLADTLKGDLFSPTASEQKRLDTLDTVETAVAGLSLAQAAKAVLLGGGKALTKIAAGLRKESDEAAKGSPSIPNSGANSAANAARLNMQMVAEQAAGTRAPTQITGYSNHALEQIAGRDGGIGVSQSALNNAWSNPQKIEYFPSKYGPTFRYTGKDAVIVVNTEGNVVTAWGKSAAGTGK
jgi:filamentous hemagglutinin